MAKRRDILIAQAQDKEAKAVIATLRGVKSITVALGLPVRKKNEQGKVYKQVSVLHCTARVAGMLQTIEKDMEVEADEKMGVCAEMKNAVAPALAAFCDHVVATVLAKLKADAKPLDPEVPPPLPSMPRAPSKVMKEVGAMTAASRRGRPATEPPEQFDEAEHADPEEGGEA